jgi:nucleotide-binding universal stress UspA family protein
VLGAGLVARYGAKRVAVPVTVAEEQARKPVTESAIRASIPANAARLLVPTRGHPKLMKFAIDYAKDKGAALFVLFVREVALAFRERGENLSTMTLASDKDAQAIFANARRMCDEANVPMVQLYAVHDSPAELILDHAATLGADAVLMGVSKRGALWKTLRGDVLQEVIEYLPESIPLLIHA